MRLDWPKRRPKKAEKESAPEPVEWTPERFAEQFVDLAPQDGKAIIASASHVRFVTIIVETIARNDMSQFVNHRADRCRGGDEQIRLFTEHHAEMCLASRYSEAIACNIDSDEQQDALHCDYLDAERIRYYCLANYFRRRGISSFYARASNLVGQHAQAIRLVAERLLAGETLDHEQVLLLANEAN